MQLFEQFRAQVLCVTDAARGVAPSRRSVDRSSGWWSSLYHAHTLFLLPLLSLAVNRQRGDVKC